MDSEKVGFTAKAVPHSSSYSIKLPSTTAQSLNLQPEDLLKLELRNMHGEKVDLTRKVMGKDQHLKIYIPKNDAENLALEKGDLVDVFISKD